MQFFNRRGRLYADQVLTVLGDLKMEGRLLRQTINSKKWFWRQWSGPFFYSFIAKMEDAGIIYHYGEPLTIIEGDYFYNVTVRVYQRMPGRWALSLLPDKQYYQTMLYN